MPPRPKVPDEQIPCSSPAQLAAHVSEMQTLFLQPESEHTWERFGKALNKLAAMTRGGAYQLDNFQQSVGSAAQGGLGEKIVQCILSERAALSKPAVELATSIATCLGTHFTERLQRLYIPPLLDLIRRTNNIVRERAEHALFNIIRSCPLPSLIGYLAGAMKDNNAKLRRAITAGAALAVEGWKAGGRVEDVEGMIKQLTADKDVDVRKAARELWDRYKVTWPERVHTFIGPMSPTTKKRLDIKDTDTYPLHASGALGKSPSSSNLSSSTSSNPGAVPAKKMGARSFIAQKKAELARQRAAAAAAAEAQGASPLPSDASASAAPSPARSASPAPTFAQEAAMPSLPSSPTENARPSTSYLPDCGPYDFASSPSLLSQLPPLPPSQPSTPQQQTPSRSPLPRSSPLVPATPTPTASAPSPAPAAAVTPIHLTPARPPRSPARVPPPSLDPFSPQAASGPPSPAPPSPLPAPSSSSAAPAAAPAPPPPAATTPLHPASRALRTAAAFQNSPPPSLPLGQHGTPKHRDLLDGAGAAERALREFSEWRKVSSARREGAPASASPSRPTAAVLDEPAEGVRALIDFSAATSSTANGASATPESQLIDVGGSDDDALQPWKENGLFEGVLEKLLGLLGSKDVPDVEGPLVLLETLVDNQWPLFQGHEGPLFEVLLRLRAIARPSIRQGTTALFATASAHLSPIFCLYTLSSTLRALLPPPSAEEAQRGFAFGPNEPGVAQGFAFGLLELGRVFMRLPAEVVSEELPRLKDLLLPGLYSSLLPVRESASTAILAAQLIILDEGLVFSLLEGLTSDKVHLLTYMFEKNRIRGEGAGKQGEGRERVEREMRRLSLQAL